MDIEVAQNVHERWVTTPGTDAATKSMPQMTRGRADPRSSVLNYLVSCLLFLAPVSVLAASPLLIGEVNWAGSSASSADEWVEIWNTDSQDQSLAGFQLEGASARPIVFLDTDVIPAHGVFLLSNYAETNEKSALAAHATMIKTDVALSNESLHLVLRNAEGQAVDEVGDGSRPAAGATHPQTSMVRVPGETLMWTSATSSLGFDPGVVDIGTPGICDGCTRAEESTTTTTESVVEDHPLSEDSLLESGTTSSSMHTIEETTPTPTNPLDESPSSTAAIVTEAITETSTTTDLILLDTEDIPSSSSTNELATAPPFVATTCEWSLAALLPAPSNGIELVQVTGCFEATDLLDWSIHDTQGLIVRVTSSTLLALVDSDTWQITLPGQHLNNTGDSVSLYGPNGRLYDQVTYPALQHDEHYTKHADGTWWIPERTPPSTIAPTPISSVSPLTSLSVLSTTSTSSTTPTSASTSYTTSSRARVATVRTLNTSSTHLQTSAKKVTSMSWAQYQALHTTSSKATPPKPKPMAKSTARKPASTRSATPSLSPRVHLHGIVGTPAGLIAKRRFVLLNADGTGLLVYGTNTQPSPPFGSSIDVFGSLITNDDGIHLEMRSKDVWRITSTTSSAPRPAIIDLSLIETEDAWSLVEVRGRIETRGTTNVHMTLEDTDEDVVVALPRQIGYRPQRLQKGDLVRIRGILDVRNTTIQLHPRTLEDITLIEHAATSSSATTASTRHTNLPPWTPPVVAGSTIAAGYGFSRLRSWYKQRQLARQLTLAIDRLPASS